ncbi:MAG: alpha-amylase [Paraprevotella sp.]|nr:alpha-amylase [Paraprevotella sp.]
MTPEQKIIIYQVFTRLFGNDNARCTPNGSIEENGCGKMADFTSEALARIHRLGATHIWYTGIIEHATQTDYSTYGIARDHKAVVKGKAGSPYAIKDYYDIDPDLAKNVDKRMNEYLNLVKRTHKAGLKMIIDFVPNHVARQYHSDARPEGVKDLGENDDCRNSFDPQNNFYYIPGEELHTDFARQQDGTAPYREMPAKATGNDNFSAWPGTNDWYETVKLNYGIDYCGGHRRCFSPTPDTWYKMRDILLFWAATGIDGFRCDMAEMVPAEFWGWVIPQIKAQYPAIVFIAEVYNPAEYRNYIFNGRFDYLYDKVGLYDTLRGVTCGYTPACAITGCWQSVDDIKDHMLNFLENHDEQRLASDFFAGDARKGRPALLVSACMGTNPMMVYFGQELGERGMDAEGFSGRDGRTTIFDYWSIDTIRRSRKNRLTESEKELQDYYTKVLRICNEETAIRAGQFYDLMYVNPAGDGFNPEKQYAFLRRSPKTLLLIVANFDEQERTVSVRIPRHAFDFLQMKEKASIAATDLLTGRKENISFVPDAPVTLTLPGNEGKILKIKA